MGLGLCVRLSGKKRLKFRFASLFHPKFVKKRVERDGAKFNGHFFVEDFSVDFLKCPSSKTDIPVILVEFVFRSHVLLRYCMDCWTLNGKSIKLLTQETKKGNSSLRRKHHEAFSSS